MRTPGLRFVFSLASACILVTLLSGCQSTDTDGLAAEYLASAGLS